MKRTLAIALAAASLAACAETPMGLSSPSATSGPTPYPGATSGVFEARDFGWSTGGGAGAIIGGMNYRAGGVRYSCEGKDVILIPETPWSRRRMIILYGSDVSAAVPPEIVRDRTPATPPDFASYVRKSTCDGANHFSFSGLPDGAWYVITIAHPMGGEGEPLALMRRVEIHGGPRSLTLN